MVAIEVWRLIAFVGELNRDKKRFVPEFNKVLNIDVISVGQGYTRLLHLSTRFFVFFEFNFKGFISYKKLIFVAKQAKWRKFLDLNFFMWSDRTFIEFKVSYNCRIFD